MKKLLLIASFVGFLLLTGCEGQQKSSETFCWDFNTTIVTSISGASVPGYPQTVRSKSTQCGLTEEQAEQVVKTLTTTTTSSVQGIKATIKTTCTKKKQ